MNTSNEAPMWNGWQFIKQMICAFCIPTHTIDSHLQMWTELLGIQYTTKASRLKMQHIET